MSGRPDRFASRRTRLSARVYDPETRRSRCLECGREVASGQQQCVCGAAFDALTVTAQFGNETAGTIGEQELER